MYASALDWVSILFLSEIFLIECIPYYFFVHKKSVSKRKVYIIFLKNIKFKKPKKNQKTHF